MCRNSRRGEAADELHFGRLPDRECARPTKITWRHDLTFIWFWTNICPDMSTISYSAARENLAATMDQVCDDCEPVVITRQKQRSVVMLSLDDYESLAETACLLKSRANARRLLVATKQLESGKGKTRKIVLDA
jgi:antitoxin YefM